MQPVAQVSAPTAAPSVLTAPVQTEEALIERICRDLEREFAGGLPSGIDLVAVARDAVAQFAAARVTVFVPVLALRAARASLADRPR